MYGIPKEIYNNNKETPKLQTIKINQKLKNETRTQARRLSAVTNSTIAAGEKI